MELLEQIFNFIFDSRYTPPMLIVLVVMALVGITAQFALYDKCGLPGVACLVPVWNVTTFLKIVGRPAWQSLFIIVPPLIALAAIIWDYKNPVAWAIMGGAGLIMAIFMILVYIEVCKSFNKTKIVDYFLIIIFNGFYVMYLGFSDSAKYKGPVYNN